MGYKCSAIKETRPMANDSSASNAISARSFYSPSLDAYKASHLLCYLARGEEGLVSQNPCHNSLKATFKKHDECQKLLTENAKGTLFVSADNVEGLIEFLAAKGSGNHYNRSL